MSATLRVQAILRSDIHRWHLLDVVSSLQLPDCWIGAGFVRNAVWDHLHGRPPTPPAGDIDVIWHDPRRADRALDEAIQRELHAVAPDVQWSVKNQARMHERNGDDPYASAVEAMRYWPETATAVAVRRHENDQCEIAAPCGLDDLLALVLRPTPRFQREKRGIYEDRLRLKSWLATWPDLRMSET